MEHDGHWCVSVIKKCAFMPHRHSICLNYSVGHLYTELWQRKYYTFYSLHTSHFRSMFTTNYFAETNDTIRRHIQAVIERRERNEWISINDFKLSLCVMHFFLIIVESKTLHAREMFLVLSLWTLRFVVFSFLLSSLGVSHIILI